jgi:NAD(P)H dehydrogenase (quinone)
MTHLRRRAWKKCGLVRLTTVLTTDGHAGQVYELGGDEAFTQSEIAAAISDATGKQVTYTELPAPKLAQVLAGAGLPTELPDILADNDLGWSRGELFTSSGDLRRLIGRPTTPLADAVAAALR